MTQATGVAWLIQQRGPAVYEHEWDHSIFKSFVPLIVSIVLIFVKFIYDESRLHSCIA